MKLPGVCIQARFVDFAGRQQRPAVVLNLFEPRLGARISALAHLDMAGGADVERPRGVDHGRQMSPEMVVVTGGSERCLLRR